MEDYATIGDDIIFTYDGNTQVPIGHPSANSTCQADQTFTPLDVDISCQCKANPFYFFINFMGRGVISFSHCVCVCVSSFYCPIINLRF